MLRALDLAELGRGNVEPNPVVGAVVVRDGNVVGEGFHQKYGGPHAEVEALNAAGDSARGATLYVSLEPCCHFGKTPPCTDAILRAGVREVYAAMEDPFPAVGGKGIAILRAAGVTVHVGLLEQKARQVNAPFLKRLRTGRPFVCVKWAQSIDGRVATSTGESRWISGPESRAIVHRERGRMDAILVGLGTAARDDPLLTARPDDPALIRRVALRVVLDTHCQLDVSSKLASTARDFPVLLIHGNGLTDEEMRRAESLRQRGVELLAVSVGPSGRVSLADTLDQLGRRGFSNVYVEGGPTVAGAFIQQDLADALDIFVAPILLGDKAKPAVGGLNVERLADAKRFELCSMNPIGEDMLLRYRRIAALTGGRVSSPDSP